MPSSEVTLTNLFPVCKEGYNVYLFNQLWMFDLFTLLLLFVMETCSWACDWSRDIYILSCIHGWSGASTDGELLISLYCILCKRVIGSTWHNTSCFMMVGKACICRSCCMMTSCASKNSAIFYYVSDDTKDKQTQRINLVPDMLHVQRWHMELVTDKKKKPVIKQTSVSQVNPKNWPEYENVLEIETLWCGRLWRNTEPLYDDRS